MKYKKFRLVVTLSISENWIEDGANVDNIKERLKEFLEEELNPFSVEGEYIAEIK